MSNNDKLTPEDISTCITALWSLLVTMPLFLYIVYSVVQGLPDKPISLQIALWVYIPSHVLGMILVTITKFIKD